jgi:hypothetical protein
VSAWLRAFADRITGRTGKPGASRYRDAHGFHAATGSGPDRRIAAHNPRLRAARRSAFGSSGRPASPGEVRTALALGQRHEHVRQRRVSAESRDQAVAAIAAGAPTTLAVDPDNGGREVAEAVGTDAPHELTSPEIRVLDLHPARTKRPPAGLLGLILVKERRRPGLPSLANVVTIISAEWTGWLKLGGGGGQKSTRHG